MTDPGDHEADPADHDQLILVITMRRSWRSRSPGACTSRAKTRTISEDDGPGRVRGECRKPLCLISLIKSEPNARILVAVHLPADVPGLHPAEDLPPFA